MKKGITDVFRDPPAIGTQRLVLRRLERDDWQDMYEYSSLPAVTRFLTWEPHPDASYTRRYLIYASGRYKAGDFFDWAVCLRDSGKMIGTCGFTRLDEKNGAGEIGYVLNPRYHRLGLGTEAACRVLDFGFDELSLHRIEARFMPGNEASLALARKCGMSLEGTLRESLLIKGRFVSVSICSVLRDDYFELRRAREQVTCHPLP